LIEAEKPAWFFAPLGGGEESGLNESGIEAFKRVDSLGRETCQNILDHPDGSGRPCIAVFEYLDLPREDFPGWDEFIQIFRACQEHVVKMLPDGAGNERRFFQKGLELLNAKTIPVLRIGDENTTGLQGGDDDRSQGFWRLLKGQGFSSLQGVGGGTYGIGQRAPFARSALRTVIYSTRLASGDEAFIAKAILASHRNPFDLKRSMTQSKGWYCHAPGDGQQLRAIRDESLIRPRFRRTAVGTDLYVTGYLEQDWEQHVRHSVLQNFFAAIDRGQLEVRLMKNGGLLSEINRANLEERLSEAADQARRLQSKTDYRQGLGATVYYLKALRQPLNGTPAARNIDNLGSTKLFIFRDTKDADVPERWACMRRPLMLVEDHGSGLLSRFAAVFVCDDAGGNQLLAQMEDPRHSRWHEEEARNWTPAEQKGGRETRLAINRFVSETLKQIRDQSMPPSQDIPFLGRYLPLDTDEEDTAVGAALQPTGGSAPIETGHQTTPSGSGVLSGRARRLPPPSVRIQGIASVTSATGAEAGGEGGAGSSGGEGGEAAGSGPGQGSGTGGTAPKGAGASEPGQNADPGGARTLGSADVRFRSFLDGGHYCVVLESARDLSGEMELRSVGEDSSYPVRIVSARDALTGKDLAVAGSRVAGIALKAGHALRIHVVLDTSDHTPCLTLGR
jgi:hypothetical protein